MNKKIVIVIGVLRGFGQLVVVKFVKLFFVIVIIRQFEKVEQFWELVVVYNVVDFIYIIVFDVIDEQFIVLFGKVISVYVFIDFFVNNVGMVYGGFVEDVLMEYFR